MNLRVPNSEASIDDVELIALEVELLLHARKIGVEQVASIQLQFYSSAKFSPLLSFRQAQGN